jgi:hypothetical protein
LPPAPSTPTPCISYNLKFIFKIILISSSSITLHRTFGRISLIYSLTIIIQEIVGLKDFPILIV